MPTRSARVRLRRRRLAEFGACKRQIPRPVAIVFGKLPQAIFCREDSGLKAEGPGGKCDRRSARRLACGAFSGFAKAAGGCGFELLRQPIVAGAPRRGRQACRVACPGAVSSGQRRTNSSSARGRWRARPRGPPVTVWSDYVPSSGWSTPRSKGNSRTPALRGKGIQAATRSDVVRVLDRIAEENGGSMADHRLAYLYRSSRGTSRAATPPLKHNFPLLP